MDITWDCFAYVNSANKRDAFEKMCRLLFKHRFCSEGQDGLSTLCCTKKLRCMFFLVGIGRKVAQSLVNSVFVIPVRIIAQLQGQLAL